MMKYNQLEIEGENGRVGDGERERHRAWVSPSPPLPFSPSSLRPGFTAVELVMVVLILAILAAAAAPKYADALSRFRVDAAARRIVADLATAQARARATSGSLSIVFTLPPQGSRYQIVGMKDPDRPAATYTVNLADSPYLATLRSASFGGDATLVYNGYGIPDSGGTIVVYCGQYAKTVTIDPTTGMAAIP